MSTEKPPVDISICTKEWNSMPKNEDTKYI